MLGTYFYLFLFFISGKVFCLELAQRDQTAAFNSKSFRVVSLYQKVNLPPALSYHSSQRELAEVHIGKPSFFIAKKTGTVKIQMSSKKSLEFLILSDPQMNFYNKMKKFLVEDYHKYKIKDQRLYLKMISPSLSLKKVALILCRKIGSQHILLDFSEDKLENYESCLQEQIKEKKYKLALYLKNRTKNEDSNRGLGLPQELDWTFKKQLSLAEAKGSAKLGSNKIKNKNSSLFYSFISASSPLEFSKGLEVGFSNNSLFSNQPIQWKKISNQFKIELQEDHRNSLKLKISIDRRNRSEKENVISEDSFSKTLNIQKRAWVQIFKQQEEQNSGSSTYSLFSSLLGGRNNGEGRNHRELWIRVDE